MVRTEMGLEAHPVCSQGRGSTEKQRIGTSLVAQWLRLHAPNAGIPSSIPGQGIRSHMLQLKILHATMKIKDPACCC